MTRGHQRRAPRTKRQRQRIRNLTHPTRSLPARRVRVHPDPRRPFVVEVRIARNRRHMHEEIRRLDRQDEDPRTQGMVRCWYSTLRWRPLIRPRGVIARMYLNVADLRRRPSEIVSHEATHAGLAWGRLQRANLDRMAGEEIVCHAVGQLMRQINHHCFALGVW
jgi:hypothetical protein